MRIHFKGRRLFMHGGRIHAHPHSDIHKRMNNTKMDHQTNISKLKTELSKMNINKNIRKKIRF